MILLGLDSRTNNWTLQKNQSGILFFSSAAANLVGLTAITFS
jgi:hypothetical protein